MPYRRLPKTDAARIKAMKTLLDKEDAFSSGSRVVSWKTLNDVQKAYDRFMTAYLLWAFRRRLYCSRFDIQ